MPALIIAPTAPWQQPRRRFPGYPLARDIERYLKKTLGPLDPLELLAPSQIAEVNRLLIRGARAFALVTDYQRAKPFPSTGAFTASLAVLALLRLLVRLDPRVIKEIAPD